jgi:hypothetical protein
MVEMVTGILRKGLVAGVGFIPYSLRLIVVQKISALGMRAVSYITASDTANEKGLP